MNLTEEVRAEATRLGADVVGFAPVDRFANAPLRMSPQGLLPGSKFVVVCGMHHLDAAVELGGFPTPHDAAAYGSQCWGQNFQLDDLSFRLARFLEARGHRALCISASNIWRYKGYKDIGVDFAPDMAHRYAAVAAGLAEIGWNNLALTPEFGPRCRFVSVVTDAEFEATPMYEGEPLCDKCMACVRNCPTEAFEKEVKGLTAVEIGTRRFEFPETNKWRCAWAENFCLNLALPIPDKVDESVIRAHIEKHGMHGGELGSCLKYCMVPRKRTFDPDYCRGPRRVKTPDGRTGDELVAALGALADRYPIDVWAVGAASRFADDGPFHPAYHLPDARTVISIGMSAPPGSEGNGETKEAAPTVSRLQHGPPARYGGALGDHAAVSLRSPGGPGTRCARRRPAVHDGIHERGTPRGRTSQARRRPDKRGRHRGMRQGGRGGSGGVLRGAAVRRVQGGPGRHGPRAGRMRPRP
ncbi:MAG: epoxyqueuosine reductase [Candidatus Hydrogenedentes bacterium]|nr:epoxyqueuosine reductase [Candidatus Hydrogenedentota bacterium]